MADRVVRDEIHRDILIPSSIGTLIDTKEFQRLRNVLQLSTCYYVFPSATHTRFSHSLGAYHLAKTLCDSLKEYQPDIFHEGDDELVAIAALLHDIGHPPFSHLLETPEVFATYHHHEHWGKLILESNDTEIGPALRNLLGESRFQRLFAIYRGDDVHDGIPIPRFLKEIVSSQLDVDRMDYIVRDERNTGAQIGGFDIDRVFRALRVGSDGGLYAKAWGLPAIEAYLVTRYHMYHQVYFHKVNKLTQSYLVAMLKRARTLHEGGNLSLGPKLTAMLTNENLSVKQYTRLTDADIIVAMDDWVESDDEYLSKLASKMKNRRDFHKSIRIPELNQQMAEKLRPKLLQLLKENGFVEEDLITAKISSRGYMPYQEGIKLEDGRDVSEHSVLVQSLIQSNEKILIFIPEEVRDSCEQIAREIVKPTQTSLSRFAHP